MESLQYRDPYGMSLKPPVGKIPVSDGIAFLTAGVSAGTGVTRQRHPWKESISGPDVLRRITTHYDILRRTATDYGVLRRITTYYDV